MSLRSSIVNSRILYEEDAPLIAQHIFLRLDKKGDGYLAKKDLNEIERLMSENFKTLAYQRNAEGFLGNLKDRLDYDRDGYVTYNDILTFVNLFMCNKGKVTQLKNPKIPKQDDSILKDIERLERKMDNFDWIDQLIYKHKSKQRSLYSTHNSRSCLFESQMGDTARGFDEDDFGSNIDDMELPFAQTRNTDIPMYNRERDQEEGIKELEESIEHFEEENNHRDPAEEEGEEEYEGSNYRSPYTCRSPETEYTEEYSMLTTTPRSEQQNKNQNPMSMTGHRGYASASTFHTDQNAESHKRKLEALQKIRESQKPKFDEISKERKYAGTLFFEFDRDRRGHITTANLKNIISQMFARIGMKFVPSDAEIASFLKPKPFDLNRKLFKSEFEDVIVKSLKFRGIKFV